MNEETICNYAPLKNFSQSEQNELAETADNSIRFHYSQSLLKLFFPAATTFNPTHPKNALVIITDKNSFNFNDCTIEKFLFQLSCTSKRKRKKVFRVFVSVFPFHRFSHLLLWHSTWLSLERDFFLLSTRIHFQICLKIPHLQTSIMTYFSDEYLPLKCTFSTKSLSFLRLFACSLTHSFIGITLIFTLF